MDAAGGRRPAAHTAPLQVVLETGHRGRLGGDSETGGAGNGTPGEVREVGRGFRDRWGEKWDTGCTWTGISGQVELEMGHRVHLGGDSGTGGAGNGTPGEVGGFEGEAEGRGARSGGKMGPKSEAVD